MYVCCRLRAAGKPHKLVLVACMRKLLTILNAMLRTQTTWTPHENRTGQAVPDTVPSPLLPAQSTAKPLLAQEVCRG